MNTRWILAAAFSTLTLFLSACGGGSFQGNDFASKGPASSEPAYYGKPSSITNGLRVQMAAKFLYRQLDFNPSVPATDPYNGLGSVVDITNAIPIPFAEFHIYDSSGNRVQQGETTTKGIADFKIPKVAGTYTLKVFSRAYNDYLKISILEDIYNNIPYSISKDFTISSSDIAAGTADLTATPVIAEANENISSKIEGGAFNIYFDILIANEYIRRNISKNGVSNDGVPTTDVNKWWVADKVTVFWKAGFNPYTYFNSSTPLSFYSPGERKLYILGGVNGDVKASDTDHFDDSVILHEYGHFLEDAYGHSESPGGSHNGNFIIDARLAWSEGWANYLQSAVLTGADAYDHSSPENRVPTNKRYQYYVDTYGYKGTGRKAGLNITFNLAAQGTDGTQPDNVSGDLPGAGIFREVSVARTLYKSTRGTASTYDGGKSGGGISFTDIWKSFAGENTTGNNKTNPLTYSLRKSSIYPIPNSGLFNWLLVKNTNRNGTEDDEWNKILVEEKQNKTTHDYSYFLAPGNCGGVDMSATPETKWGGINRSHQQMNNDFYLYFHDGSSATLRLEYSVSGSNAPELDLILYYGSYVYFEDDYWYGGYTSPYIAKSNRTIGTTKSIDLSGLPAGYYMLNVKANVYGKTLVSQVNGTSTYILKKNGAQICGTEQP